jgi:hypothetical protein
MATVADGNPELSAEFLTFTKQAYESDPTGPFAQFLKMEPKQCASLNAAAALRRVVTLLRLVLDRDDAPLRFEADEFVYQGLIPSIRELSGMLELPEIGETITKSLPESLEISRRSWTPTCWRDVVEPALAHLTSELHILCAGNRVSPYHPGPDVLLTAQDDYLDTIQQPPRPNAALRRPVLSAESWKPYLGLELQGAMDAISTIRTLVVACFPRPGYIAVIPEDDGGLLETLRMDAEYLLTGWPDLWPQLDPLIPNAETLHPSAARYYDAEVVEWILGNVDRARSLILRVLLANGRMTDNRLPPFAMFDRELAERAESSQKMARTYWNQLTGETGGVSAKGPGRPKGSAFNMADLEAKLRNYLKTAKVPSKTEYLEFAGISSSSFTRITKSANTNWTNMLRNARE